MLIHNIIIFKYLDFDLNGITTVPIHSQLTFCGLHYQNVMVFCIRKPQFMYPFSLIDIWVISKVFSY